VPVRTIADTRLSSDGVGLPQVPTRSHTFPKWPWGEREIVPIGATCGTAARNPMTPTRSYTRQALGAVGWSSRTT